METLRVSGRAVDGRWRWGAGQRVGRILVRVGLAKEDFGAKEPAEFPAAAGRPASSHEDLMVIYRGDDGGPGKAIYFDNEGHVINYAASVSDDKRTLTFLSEAAGAGPRFRLSYMKEKEDRVRIKFEMSTPGKPDAFKIYLEGSGHRQVRPKSGGAAK